MMYDIEVNISEEQMMAIQQIADLEKRTVESIIARMLDHELETYVPNPEITREGGRRIEHDQPTD